MFWENESLDALEHVRRELRGLVHLLKEQRGGKKFIIDIEDTYTKVEGVEDEVIKTSYKQRVIDYLAENSNNDTLRKIQHFEQLTSADIEGAEALKPLSFYLLTLGNGYSHYVGHSLSLVLLRLTSTDNDN